MSLAINKIIKVEDISELNKGRLKLSITYAINDKTAIKVLVAKIYKSGVINRNSTLYNFLKNFKQHIDFSEPIIVKGKMNHRLLHRLIGQSMKVYCYYDDNKKKFNYYDYYIAFNNKQVKNLYENFNKDTASKKIIVQE